MDIPLTQADAEYIGDLLILFYLVFACMKGFSVGYVR